MTGPGRAGSEGIRSKTRERVLCPRSPDVAMSASCASVRGDASINEGSNGKQDAATDAPRTAARGGYRRRSGCRVPFRLLVPLLIVISIDAQAPHDILGVQRHALPAVLKKYAILGVQRNALTAGLKKAYRRKCLELHPDKHTGATNKARAEQAFIALGKAFIALGKVR
ncbi:hypothetical protein T484DRAFT_1895946 [Baffinella frigidus]|nr:hypothetical protein T484DRAFT_1895946 [Cryptophyta sp. CCMP2293]